MKYKLIQEVNGLGIETELNYENLMAAMEIRGFKFAGFRNSPNQRIELEDQPIFKGVAGPMWDGDAIRYEDWKTYERLSA